MNKKQINFILEEFLRMELDEDVYVKDLINPEYISHAIESLHMILENLDKI